MTAYVALLRAINVGGSGMLPMKDLAALCTAAGLKNVRTYIQSGNVVFESALSEAKVKAVLERALAVRMAKSTAVMVRTASELRAILDANPLPKAKPAQVAVLFLATPAPKGLVENLSIPGPEKVQASGRQIYVHYPNGMGRSKLRFPSKLVVTARNLNTVAKLVEMSEA